MSINRSGRPARWLVAATVVTVLHYAWEMLQAPLFAEFAGLSFWEHAWPCFRAAFGDLLIAALSYGFAALAVRRHNWPFQPQWRTPFTVCVAFGLGITIGFEYYALATDRWNYGPHMPTVAGVAVPPLLQWLIVPSLTLLVLQLWLRQPDSDR